MINLVACRPAIDPLARCRLVPGNSSRNNFPFPRPSSRKGSSFLASYVLQSDHVSLLSDFHGYFWDSNESPNALPGQYSFVHVARFLSIEIPLGIAWDCPALTYIIIKKNGDWIWELRCLEGWFETCVRVFFDAVNWFRSGEEVVYTFKDRLTVHWSL